jgi:acetyl/propionyl-CoA carboxylase alpha subunit
MSRLIVTVDGRAYTIKVILPEKDQSPVTALVDGEKIDVFVPLGIDFLSQGNGWMVVNGRPLDFTCDRDLHWIKDQHGLHHIELRNRADNEDVPGKVDGRVKVPLPGRILAILVMVGQKVECGQPVAVLEAMEMFNEIQAPRAGVIKSIQARAGADVSRNEIILEIA